VTGPNDVPAVFPAGSIRAGDAITVTTTVTFGDREPDRAEAPTAAGGPATSTDVERLRAERVVMLRLIRELTDPDDCWFDHHGGCQAHGFTSLQPGEMCPHGRAKELIAVDGDVERAGYRLVAQCGYARVFANEDGTCTDHTCVLDVDHAKSPLMHVCAQCGTKYLSGPRDRRVPTAPPGAQS
jgi:hypothetical protein